MSAEPVRRGGGVATMLPIALPMPDRPDPVVDSQVVVLRPVMWMFFAMLGTFLLTRAVTRWIRARQAAARSGGPIRDITVSGVHVHHQVFGIMIMLAAGLILIAVTPDGKALHWTAAIFGVGVSLTFDEFALWLHLEDVYWSTDGRKSVDAMFCVLAVTGVLIGGADLLAGDIGTETWWASVATLGINLCFCAVCLFKGKTITGVIGVFFSIVAVIGAIRLAKPGSWWARHRYSQRPRRLARAQRRFGVKYEARWNRLRDLVAGAPSRVG